MVVTTGRSTVADTATYDADPMDAWRRIKTRAANVSRLEVEAALMTLPGVEQAVATGLPDEDADQGAN